MYKWIFVVLLLFPWNIFAQQSNVISQKLFWEQRKISSPSQNDVKDILFFEGATYLEQKGLPLFYTTFPLQQYGTLKATIIEEVYEPVDDIRLINTEKLSGNIEINTSVSIMRKAPMGEISFIPIRYNNISGRYEKLLSFSVRWELTPIAGSMRSAGNHYAANSVLSSGSWYKIGTDKTGVHKLSYSFLKDLGIDVDNIDPRNIRIYGNGGGMLPESNGASRIDDLRENAIVVVGENDGVFNSGDYVLLYAEGPDKWRTTEQVEKFAHQKHLYDSLSYYFITASLGSGKRAAPQASSGTANKVVTSFDEHIFHEIDEVNVAKSGREWYGELFTYTTTSKSFQFIISNIVTSAPVYLKSNVTARSILAEPKFIISTNGITQSHSLIKGSSTYDGIFGGESQIVSSFFTSSPNININVNFIPPGNDPEAKGHLNFLALTARRYLDLSGAQLTFRDRVSVGIGNVSEFQVTSGAAINIWEVTDPGNVAIQNFNLSGNIYKFTLPTEQLREFVAFNPSGNLYTPIKIGRIDNQNIHGTIGQPDLVIVTHPSVLAQAQQLAAHHQSYSGLSVSVQTVDKIYNEFSSGAQDITAIRDMMRMLYERATTAGEMPRFLLLFGDASYDYKDLEVEPSLNTNVVPTYQSYNSLSYASTFCTDDYFGLLDSTEGGNIGNILPGKIDIGIGRLPVEDPTEAAAVVAKILHYTDKASYGNWRNNVTLVSDDEDFDQWIDESEWLGKYMDANHPVYIVDKIYLDAYKQESTPGGNRYPEATKALNNRMYKGSLVINYIGHGGEAGLAHERLLGLSDINNWENFDKLPLFITVTCSFTRFDNPYRKTAGEMVLLKPDGGGIALLSTVRLATLDISLTRSLFKDLFIPKANGLMPTLGESVMFAKNEMGGTENNRKFQLIGDPAMRLAYPKEKVKTTEIYATPVAFSGDTIISDTLKALAKVTIRGEVQNSTGNKLTSFTGIVYPTIYDKQVEIVTLANDPGANKIPFMLEKNIVYKGKASVNAGEFEYTFVVPKDIAYNIGAGKISYYAHTDGIDAHGYDKIFIGGTADSVGSDNQGPKVEIFMNDEKFVFGGLTDENPLMIVKLYDENGINTAGSAIGHDISGMLDDDSQGSFSLNDFYEAALDNYQEGEVRYPLYELPEGRHTVKVKAWDVYNNPGDGYTEFVVARSAQLALSHVLNYPNPFTTSTHFWFEHNRPGELLNVKVQIYTVSGKLVKSIHQDIISEGNRVDNIHWDGKDEYGDKIGKGVYVYKVDVRGQDGLKAHKFEKLVILQ